MEPVRVRTVGLSLYLLFLPFVRCSHVAIMYMRQWVVLLGLLSRPNITLLFDYDGLRT